MAWDNFDGIVECANKCCSRNKKRNQKLKNQAALVNKKYTIIMTCYVLRIDHPLINACEHLIRSRPGLSPCATSTSLCVVARLHRATYGRTTDTVR